MRLRRAISKTVVLAGAILVSGSVSIAAIIPSPSTDLLLSSNGGVADINGDPSDGGQNYGGLPPANLNDGDRNGVYNNGQGVDGAGSIAHTATQAANQFMEVTLPSPKAIDSVIVFNRTDCCDQRIDPFELQVLNGASIVYDTGPGQVFTPDVNLGQASGMTFNFATVLGDKVKIIQANNTFMNLAELEAYSPVPEPASFVLFGLGAVGFFVAARRRLA